MPLWRCGRWGYRSLRSVCILGWRRIGCTERFTGGRRKVSFKPRRFVVGRSRPRHIPGQMNKLEQAYGEHLTLEKIAGNVIEYWFEGVKFKLADNTFYTPDFLVQLSSGELEVHETKGFWEEDARVKIKVAADKFPFRFVG